MISYSPSPSTLSARAFARINVSSPDFTVMYSAEGFTQSATLDGSVQGVVVQARM